MAYMIKLDGDICSCALGRMMQVKVDSVLSYGWNDRDQELDKDVFRCNNS